MDIVSIAEENFLITFAVIVSIGLLQGAILGRGIRNKFPSLKRHARIVSLTIFTLFSINAIANVFKFAVPEKISLSNLTIPSTPEEGFELVTNVLGLNAGLGTVIVLFVSITLILFMKFAEIPAVARYFIFSLSIIVVSVAIIGRFTDFVPTIFQVIMYAIYQFGITLGIFLVTRRKETDVLSEIE